MIPHCSYRFFWKTRFEDTLQLNFIHIFRSIIPGQSNKRCGFFRFVWRLVNWVVMHKNEFIPCWSSTIQLVSFLAQTVCPSAGFDRQFYPLAIKDDGIKINYVFNP